MMRKSIALKLAVALSAVGLAAAIPSQAQVTPPALQITDGTNTVTVDANDNVTMSAGCVCTTISSSGTSGAPGNVTWEGTLGIFFVTAQGNAQNGSFQNPDLSANVINTGTTTGTVTVSWTSVGFAGAGSTVQGSAETTIVNGTGSVNYNYYIDNTNAPFGTGTLVGTLSNIVSTLLGPVWSSGSGATFSATEVEAITLGTGANFNGDNEMFLYPQTLSVACPSASGKVGTAYNSSITASGGIPAYVFSIATGALAPGLTLNASTGAITGSPTSAGSYSFTVEATDTTGTSATSSCGQTIALGGGGGQGGSLTLSCPSTTGLTEGVYYSSSFVATNGTSPYVFTISAGKLPAGLKLNAKTGSLSGSPSGSGSFTFTGTVTDSSSPALTATSSACTGTISAPPPPLSLSCATSTGSIGGAYSSAVVATGGTPPYVSYKLTSGSLPPGLTLNTLTGAITGSPTKSGTYSYTVQVVDTNGAKASDGSGSGRCSSKGCSITIAAPAPLSVKCPPSSATAGAAYNGSAVASGGKSPYTYSVTGGLPTGLTLDTSTGAITGTPTSAGTYNFTITAKDSSGTTSSSGKSCSGGCSITVAPSITVSCPSGSATVGTSYDSTEKVTGGTAPYTWSVISGSLPPGLSLNTSTGEIKGTPSTAGTYSLTLQVKDAHGIIGVSGSTSSDNDDYNWGYGGQGWGGYTSSTGCSITVAQSGGGGQSGGGSGCGPGSGSGGYGGGWGW